MAHFLLLVVGALVVGAVAYGVTWVITGHDRGLDPEEPDGRAVPLPSSRPLTETDIEGVRFDTTIRGYRMDQVDAALRRAAYDLGYKEELIEVLEAELAAVREGRIDEAESLRVARASSQATGRSPVASETPEQTEADLQDPPVQEAAPVQEDSPVEADAPAEAATGR